MADGSSSTRRKRERCASCARPACVCLCEGIPNAPLSTNGAVVVLQHPLERRRKLRTLQCVEQILKNVYVLRGRNFPTGKSRTFDRMVQLGKHGKPIVLLYPGANINTVEEVVQQWCLQASQCPSHARRDERGRAQDRSVLYEDDRGLEQADYVLVAIDGTWQHAREMFTAMKSRLMDEANATRAHLSIRPPGFERDEEPVSRHILWLEPYKECITTLEAIAQALYVLEGENGKSTFFWMMNFLQVLHRQQAKYDPGIEARSEISCKREVASGHRYRRQSLAS